MPACPTISETRPGPPETAGRRRYEAGKVWPKEDGSPTPAHRTLDLYFDRYEDASAAVTTPVASDLFGQLKASGTPFIALFSEGEDG